MTLLTTGSTVYAAGTPTGGILIDPGHSSKSPGTTSCSAKPEYLYNNALAKTVAAFLTSKKVYVTLTHAENEEVTLLQRTHRSSGSTFLLSLHHDSVQPQFLSSQSKKRGYCSKKTSGFSIFISRKNIYFEASLRYAKALGTALLKKGFVPALHHAEPIAGENRELLIPDKGIYIFDDLIVLKTARTPALLLEAAVIVNPDDDVLASTDTFRLAVAESVYEMLLDDKLFLKTMGAPFDSLSN